MKEQGIRAGARHRPLSRFIGESDETRRALAKVAAVTAGEAMTSPAITVEPWVPIPKAAATMTSHRGEPAAGRRRRRTASWRFVTRADLVRSYVRSDEELAGTIRFEVIRQLLSLDPAAFTIEVHDGVARISGSVERRSTAEMIARMTAMVPGIIDVDASVGWRIEDRDIAPVERDPGLFPTARTDHGTGGVAMRAIVVCMKFHRGNTAAVARAIAAGIGPEAQALSTAEATAEVVATAELVVAGAPLMALRLPTDRMVEGIVVQARRASGGTWAVPTMRAWLAGAALGPGRRRRLRDEAALVPGRRHRGDRTRPGRSRLSADQLRPRVRRRRPDGAVARR